MLNFRPNAPHTPAFYRAKAYCHGLNTALGIISLAAVSLTLSGCMGLPATTYAIDSQSYQAQGKSQRIKYIVLHYTAENEPESLRILTTANVSAHYLIPITDDKPIYQLVPDNQRAWHAGQGSFAGRSILNDTSIGIEIVNEGIQQQFRKAKNTDNDGYHPAEHYVEFTDIQIKKIAQLVQDLAQKYEIEPTLIIGHSDMAPSRKIDPGAKFPWERLYKEYGIGAWYEEADKQQFMTEGSFQSATVADIQQMLSDYGYDITPSDEWDRSSRNVVYAFQLHFRPQKLTGQMDLETYAILKALNKKYHPSN
ncbi:MULTISPECIES: N-acetylmuramoyl-L-alanine amidase [Psychrobacter]|uniref:N-acetylmuramoyl-L-alanine amidase n=1 Tax=Psychrobacter sp. (strain PRwf-1) TaxID=349106 RepID=A5WCW3_PSYWF|nr:N-acetylmuramoyl-L-alanine amidase [Psychrobacter sp. YP14]